MNRKTFLARGLSGLLYPLAAGALSSNALAKASPVTVPVDENGWIRIRKMFSLRNDMIHMSAMLLASHPEPVREAIAFYNHKLDTENASYLVKVNRANQNAARKAAAGYLNVNPDDIALTESTTIGLGIVYRGLQLKKGDEIIVASGDYYSTYQAIHLTTQATGAKMVEVDIYSGSLNAEKNQIIKKITSAITPMTRVIALTWVHSGTGLKLPMKELGHALRQVNALRSEDDRFIVCVDGVHAFGVENFTMSDLGCDLFISGCHKWLFGPRGTGIVWGNQRAWKKLVPVIPSFLEEDAWKNWREKKDFAFTTAALISPGGFKSFENLWALPEAFKFHQQIGKASVASRTHALADKLKKGLLEMEHVILHTPRNPELSSGIICFDVKRKTPHQVVEHLEKKMIIASVTPYSGRHARLTPCIYNSPAEVSMVLKEINNLR